MRDLGRHLVLTTLITALLSGCVPTSDSTSSTPGATGSTPTTSTPTATQSVLIAGDIKVALLTTVFGLIVAMILQVFYNYIIAKIDAIVNDMEDASISLIDVLVAKKIK